MQGPSAPWRRVARLDAALVELCRTAGAGTSAGEGGWSVLVTSASRKVPLLLAVRRALEACRIPGGVFAGDSDPHSAAGQLADGFWHMPPLARLDTAAVIAWCHAHRVRAIVPTRDGELAYWAAAREALEASGIAVLVSAPQVIARCVDKLAFAGWAAAAGFAAVPTHEDIDALPEGTTRYVVKERRGAGARHIAVDVDRGTALDHARSLVQPVFQPWIAGQEISADAFLTRAGRCKGVVLRTRDVVLAGESQITTTFRSDALESLVARVLEALGAHGHVILQLIVDAQDRCWVLECNARFGGASTLSLAAGLDSLAWFLRESGTGRALDEVPFVRSADTLRQVRIPSDIIIRLVKEA